MTTYCIFYAVSMCAIHPEKTGLLIIHVSMSLYKSYDQLSKVNATVP